jgi:hypothetical protein
LFTVVIAGSLAACTSGGSGGPSPNPSQAADQLQRLARLGQQQSYTAIYTLQQTAPPSTVVVQVGHTPTEYRLNLQTGTSVSTLIHNATGTYSCRTTVGRPATCFIVAKPGSPVPALFDAGQKVWSEYLVEFATNTSAYLVTPAGTSPATSVLPAGTCFAVAPIATPPPVNAVGQGTYCLTQGGIPTKAAFQSGTFTLTRIDPAPRPRAFVPLAPATPIPGLK